MNKLESWDIVGIKGKFAMANWKKGKFQRNESMLCIFNTETNEIIHGGNRLWIEFQWAKIKD